MSSCVRQQLLPNCQPEYAGYLAWRGVAHADRLSPEVQHHLADKATMYKVGLAMALCTDMLYDWGARSEIRRTHEMLGSSFAYAGLHQGESLCWDCVYTRLQRVVLSDDKRHLC